MSEGMSEGMSEPEGLIPAVLGDISKKNLSRLELLGIILGKRRSDSGQTMVMTGYGGFKKNLGLIKRLCSCRKTFSPVGFSQKGRRAATAGPNCQFL
jgi:hypothetical protein